MESDPAPARARKSAVMRAAGEHPIEQLQRLAGNRAVTQLLAERTVGGPIVARATKRPADPGPPPLPPRPSDPASQMAALVRTAKSGITGEVGTCYHAVKIHIKKAGGYGDILDIWNDKRFLPQTWATQFSDIVDRLGANALGLEEIGGSPANAPAGTLLVLNGGTMRISKAYGDISVIGEVQGPNLICYNDHKMTLPISGVEKALRAMYKPIARPVLMANLVPAAVAGPAKNLASSSLASAPGGVASPAVAGPAKFAGPAKNVGLPVHAGAAGGVAFSAVAGTAGSVASSAVAGVTGAVASTATGGLEGSALVDALFREREPFQKAEMHARMQIISATLAGVKPSQATVRQLLESGVSEGETTDLLLRAGHPDLKSGDKIDPSNKELVAEWKAIRDGVVRPALRQIEQAKKAKTDGRGSGGDFLLDTERSYLSKIPGGKEYLDFKWHRLDFPDTKEAVGKNPSEEHLAELRADPQLVLFQEGKDWYIKGAHQAKAERMLAVLATRVPERRANTGQYAVLTKPEFKQNAAAYDSYIAMQVKKVAGQGDLRLNEHAQVAFEKMQAAALKDGVKLIIGNSFRSRATAEANAKKADNSKAVADFSTHSLGLAVDLNLKVAAIKDQFVEQSTRMDRMVNMYKSPSYKWMAEHGREYGWFAYRNEPWHWEYNPPGFRDTFWAKAEEGCAP